MAANRHWCVCVCVCVCACVCVYVCVCEWVNEKHQLYSALDEALYKYRPFAISPSVTLLSVFATVFYTIQIKLNESAPDTGAIQAEAVSPVGPVADQLDVLKVLLPRGLGFGLGGLHCSTTTLEHGRAHMGTLCWRTQIYAGMGPTSKA